VRVCCADVVRYLVGVCRDKAVVNLCTENGRNCLHIAALTNNDELFRYLLDLKANCNLAVRFKVHCQLIHVRAFYTRCLQSLNFTSTKEVVFSLCYANYSSDFHKIR